MINFDSKNDGTWFYFDETNPDGGGVSLRELTSEQIDEIDRLTKKIKKKVQRGVVYDDIKVDERLSAKLRWRKCIIDWKGIQIDGEVVECNDANKETRMTITDVVKFMADAIEKLTETNKALEEARLKSSETSADGDSVE